MTADKTVPKKRIIVYTILDAVEFLHEGHRAQQQKQADEPQQHAATGANELAQEAQDDKAAQPPKAPNTVPILCFYTYKFSLRKTENSFNAIVT